jgi:hypothetical protein
VKRNQKPKLFHYAVNVVRASLATIHLALIEISHDGWPTLDSQG